MSHEFININNPTLPFVYEIQNKLFPGSDLLVKGIVLKDLNKTTRFSIELCCGQLIQGDHRDDKALHFNSRFDKDSLFTSGDKDIVINSLINNSWGLEQRCKNVLAEGKPFSIRFLILKNYFKIAIDNKHLCDYIHRIPINLIEFIYINGCVKLESVSFQLTSINSITPTAPLFDSLNFEPIAAIKPDIPFVHNIEFGGFVPPRQAIITLTPQMSANYFSINFFVENEYLFHIRVDFPAKTQDKKGAIVRNSTKKGKWMTEERHLNKFPFYPGITADIKIVANNESSEFYVDGNIIFNFTYRKFDECPLPSKVDRLSIEGDLNIQKFEYNNAKN